MDIKRRRKICEGCIASYENEWFCSPCKLKPFYNDQQCPCIECLVKAVCIANVADCEIFAEFNNLQG